MNSLGHDFVRTRPTTPLLAVLLFVAGALCMAAVMEDKLSRDEVVESLQARAEKLKATLRHASARPPAVAAAGNDVDTANAVARRLSARWGGFLAAIEAAQSDSDGVALLAVEPDAGRGDLRLTGEAKNMEALVGYMKTVADGTTISRLRLVSEKVKDAGGARSLEFVVEGRWQSGAAAGGAVSRIATVGAER
jgi:hypothetical protein